MGLWKKTPQYEYNTEGWKEEGAQCTTKLINYTVNRPGDLTIVTCTTGGATSSHRSMEILKLINKYFANQLEYHLEMLGEQKR